MASNAERWNALVALARIENCCSLYSCWRTVCFGDVVQLLSQIAEAWLYRSFLCNSVCENFGEFLIVPDGFQDMLINSVLRS